MPIGEQAGCRFFEKCLSAHVGGLEQFPNTIYISVVLILDRLKNEPDRVALIHQGREFTYAALDGWSDGLAAQLGKDLRDEAIGTLAPSSPEYFAAMIAIWKAGGMAVPLQPAHPLEELRHIAADAGFKMIFVHEQCTDQARDLGEGLERIRIEPSGQTKFETRPHDKDAGALMIYTSGTTGKPKGVVTSYQSLDAQIEILLEAWEWSQDDRTLNILPLHHVHGVVVLGGCALAAGARMELSAKFSPELVWDRIASQQINVFMAVPTVYAKLVEHFDTQDQATQRQWSQAAARLRLAVSGSAALPVPLFEKWKQIAGTPLLERYGLTEIGMALSNSYRGERRPGCVGKPLPRVQVRLSDEGEIQVRGPTVFREYWRQPEATRSAFTLDGWFKTGDLAEITDGDYRILGRASQDIIKSGGYKISALEIENRLLEHPNIAEAAVVGIADPTWGERVGAAVVFKNEAPFEQIADFLKPRLADYKIPRVWLAVTSLPRNAMGKIMKPGVRALFNR